MHAELKKANKIKNINEITHQKMFHREKKKTNNEMNVDTSFKFIIINDEHHQFRRNI